MTTKTAAALLLSTSLAAVGSCSKEQPPTNPPTGGEPAGATAGAPEAEGGGGGGEATEPGAPGVAWADKTFKQRQEWMGIEVLPKMKALFKEHDASQFTGFKCQTCHGDDMKEKKFAMPNDGIYPLDPKDPIKGAMAYDAEMTKFMEEKVVPQMAELLDTKPYDPATGQGLGCLTCHPSE